MPIKIRRVDFSFDEWIGGTVGMSLEEEGLYIRIVARYYSRGEALSSDPTEIANLCNLRPQVVRRLLPKLMAKFEETDGKLRQNRCETELKLASNRLETARINGAKGGHSKHLGEPGGSDARATPSTINHQPSTKESSLRSDSTRVRARDPSDVVVDLMKPVSKMSPVEKLYLGGYRAAQNYNRRHGIVEDDPASDVPLLDG